MILFKHHAEDVGCWDFTGYSLTVRDFGLGYILHAAFAPVQLPTFGRGSSDYRDNKAIAKRNVEAAELVECHCLVQPYSGQHLESRSPHIM